MSLHTCVTDAIDFAPCGSRSPFNPWRNIVSKDLCDSQEAEIKLKTIMLGSGGVGKVLILFVYVTAILNFLLEVNLFANLGK
jgi:hypothetical protein